MLLKNLIVSKLIQSECLLAPNCFLTQLSLCELYHSNLDWAIAICFRVLSLRTGWDINLFFQYRHLLLILLITFKAIDSPDKFPSNEQPRYVTALYCLMFITPYLISRLPTLFTLYFMPNSILFVFSYPKRMLRLLSINQ